MKNLQKQKKVTTNEIDFPEQLLEQLAGTRRIFLTVSPVILYSEILSALDELMASYGPPLEIISFEDLDKLEAIGGSPALIACGDIALNQLPGYVRGLVSDKKKLHLAEVISATPWLALRISSPASSSHFDFEFLLSSTLPPEGVDLCDISWTDVSVAKQRFQSLVRCTEGTQTTEEIREDDDLEFIE